MAWTKKGNEFLIEISKETLKQDYKKERNPKAKMRLLASILRKEGKSLSSIAFSLQKPVMTISDWLRRVETDGLERIYDTKQPGKPSRLTKQQLNGLRNILKESPQKHNLPYVIWTTKLARHFIEMRYNVSHSVWQVRRILKKMKFSLQKPRPEHHKANKKLQEAFKKTSRKKLFFMSKTDGRSFAWMSAYSQ